MENTLEALEYLLGAKVYLNCKDNQFKPDYADLARLHFLIRKRQPEMVLEFGSGHSSVVIGCALQDNGKGLLIAVETSKKWAANTEQMVKGLPVIVHSTGATIAEYEGQLCHFYDALPDVTPDFIYMDGPDPADVKGSINNLSFESRTVMAGDLLKYESTLVPGFFMLVDGRSNNARFLQRNLKRKYIIQYHVETDVTTFELDEPGLRGSNPLMPETAKN